MFCITSVLISDTLDSPRQCCREFMLIFQGVDVLAYTVIIRRVIRFMCR